MKETPLGVEQWCCDERLHRSSPIDDEVTQATHAKEFELRRPFRWLARLMAAPLADDFAEEIERLAERLAGHSATPTTQVSRAPRA